MEPRKIRWFDRVVIIGIFVFIVAAALLWVTALLSSGLGLFDGRGFMTVLGAIMLASVASLLVAVVPFARHELRRIKTAKAGIAEIRARQARDRR